MDATAAFALFTAEEKLLLHEAGDSVTNAVVDELCQVW